VSPFEYFVGVGGIKQAIRIFDFGFWILEKIKQARVTRRLQPTLFVSYSSARAIVADRLDGTSI